MPLLQMLPPHCNEKGEIAKPFLLFTLLFSCLKPAGTVNDEDSVLSLSDQLLSRLAAQGGSFPEETSGDTVQPGLPLLGSLRGWQCVCSTICPVCPPLETSRSAFLIAYRICVT